jgi:hypothetical protein
MSTPSNGLPLNVGTGARDGAYPIRLQVNSGDPLGSSVDFSAQEIEGVALHGVTRLDPSPFLQRGTTG